MGFQEILSELSELSDEELLQIKSRIEVLVSNSNKSINLAEYSWIYDILEEEVLACHGVAFPGIGLAKKLRYWKWFTEGCNKLTTLIESMNPKSNADRVKACRVLVRMLCRDIRHANMPVNTRTVFASLLAIDDITEREFPGYRASGLLPIILMGHLVV